MNPLELSGPDFLTFYAILIVAAMLAAGLLRWLLRQPADDSGATPTLSAYEVAYLAGGKQLAIQAALARMVHEQYLALDGRTGELTIRNILPDDAPTLEKMLYRRVHAASPGSRVRLDDATTDQTDVIHRRLEQMGLLVSAAQSFWLRCYPMMLMAAVFFLGLWKLEIGLERGKPIGFLIGLLVLTGLASLVFLWTPFRTRRGDGLLGKLRHDKRDLQTGVQQHPETVAGADLSMALGLFGVGVLTHASMADMRDGFAPHRRFGDGGSGGGGCGSGSSCSGGGGGCGGGGGGCGGGGCGGCGGG